MNEQLFEQSNSTGAAEILSSVLIFGISIAIVVSVFVVLWKFHTKAGRPGWAWIVPIYNIYTLVKIAGRPGWWTLLYFIPLVNILIAVIVALDTAKAFGRSTTFGVFGLVLFTIIGYALLAFGDDTYTQPINT